MTTSTDTVAPISSALELLASEQRVAVRHHPRWRDMALEPSPAKQLVWMVEQRLLTYDELDELQTFSEHPSEQDRIVEQAYALLGQGPALAHCGLLAQLPDT